MLSLGFPEGSAAVILQHRTLAGDAVTPGLGSSPGEGNGNPTPVFLPGESHGQRSLVGYGPWGHNTWDTTE